VPLFRRADCWPPDRTAVPYVQLCVFGLAVIFIPDHRHAQHAVLPPLPSSLPTHSLCFINSQICASRSRALNRHRHKTNSVTGALEVA